MQENALCCEDDIEYGMRNVVPLWTFGFLYAMVYVCLYDVDY